MRRRYFLGGAVGAAACHTALSADQPATKCELDMATKALLDDWPNLSRYALENEKVRMSEARVDMVFMGDSITQGWRDKRPAFFSQSRIGRGIGGQTSGQMVLRMMADVIALRPSLVHIMAGTNDVAGNTGPMTPVQSVHNIQMMAVLARAHGIGVLIGSVPPAANFPWRPGLETARAIAALNKNLAEMAKRQAVTFVDYTSALSDGSGGMKPGYAYDGVHPDIEGYAAMESVLDPIINVALARSRSRNSG